jgi:hypothetical protein
MKLKRDKPLSISSEIKSVKPKSQKKKVKVFEGKNEWYKCEACGALDFHVYESSCEHRFCLACLINLEKKVIEAK